MSKKMIDVLAQYAFVDERFSGDMGAGLRTLLYEQFGIDGSAGSAPQAVDGDSRRGPHGGHIVVQPIEESQTIGGLEVPETQAERPRRGIVRAVGPGKITELGVRIPPEVAVGDQVRFNNFAGGSNLYSLTLDDGVERGYLILREDEVLYNDGPAA